MRENKYAYLLLQLSYEFNDSLWIAAFIAHMAAITFSLKKWHTDGHMCSDEIS
jgi:hypothetical protein